jgi:hypothetical protein
MLNSFKSIVHHIVILVLSAAAALSLPYVGRFIAQNYQTYWSLLQGRKVFLIAVEIAAAVLLIIIFNYLKRSWEDRRVSSMAAKIGLVLATYARTSAARIKLQKMKENYGLSKDVMVICSTGFTTFASPDGDLHNVIKNCREAKIMLLNPFSDGTYLRARSIPDAGVTAERFKRQILASIEFLRQLQEVRQNIRLKIYHEPPLLKLAILGDYISMKFYRAGLGTEEMPEYIFEHSPDRSSLYSIFYQLFLSKWRDPAIPEYDFGAGELLYRDGSGNELRREKLSTGNDPR